MILQEKYVDSQCLTVDILDAEMTARSMDEVYVILINYESFDECDPETDRGILPDKPLPVLWAGPRTRHWSMLIRSSMFEWKTGEIGEKWLFFHRSDSRTFRLRRRCWTSFSFLVLAVWLWPLDSIEPEGWDWSMLAGNDGFVCMVLVEWTSIPRTQKQDDHLLDSDKS